LPLCEQIEIYYLILYIWKELATSWRCLESNIIYLPHCLVVNCYILCSNCEKELANWPYLAKIASAGTWVVPLDALAWQIGPPPTISPQATQTDKIGSGLGRPAGIKVGFYRLIVYFIFSVQILVRKFTLKKAKYVVRFR
jgi:hypothetical protein